MGQRRGEGPAHKWHEITECPHRFYPWRRRLGSLANLVHANGPNSQHCCSKEKKNCQARADCLSDPYTHPKKPFLKVQVQQHPAKGITRV